MNRRQHLRMGLGLLGGFAGATWLAQQVAPLHWRDVLFQGLGTTLRLRAGHTHVAELEQALQDAVRAVREVEQSMSLFDPESEISRLNRHGHLRAASPALREVLALSTQVAQASAGALDVTTQPLWQVWSAWAQAQVPLSTVWQARIERERARVNWRGVHLAHDDVHLARGQALSLNGVAQGYAADRARAVLQAHGIAHAQLDTGETSLLGHSPDGPWRLQLGEKLGQQVGAPVGAQTVPVWVARDACCLATSSDAHTFFSADRRHHHILDPRTGYSPTIWQQVSVLAPRAVLADALTKVFFMLPAPSVLATAAHWGVEVAAQDRAGGWLLSPGLRVAQPHGLWG